MEEEMAVINANHYQMRVVELRRGIEGVIDRYRM
jgi:hypothetical protein